MKNPDTSLLYKLRLLWAYRDLLRNHVPFVTRRYIDSFRQSQLAAAHRLKDKDRIDVAFMLTIPGMWKVDDLFKAMQNNPRFHPYVVIYPYSVFKGFSKDEVEDTLERTRRFISDKGYEYVIPRDEKGRWQDIKRTLHPDIVIFSAPYKDTFPPYFIYHYKDVLTCYISYSVTLFKTYHNNYDTIFHNLVGMNFVETQMHKELAKAHSRNHAMNVVVSGYPGTEVFLRNDYHPKDIWKSQSTKKKRVIWAPHHTIDEISDLPLSTFLIYADDMLRLADKYKESIQFVFKPHQLLKFKLYELWGKERTDNYYRRWADGVNTQCEETSYIDLFLTSDAMIHDSGSFTIEYLYTCKPVMFLVRNEAVKEEFSPFGISSFQQHYHAHNVEDIECFLRDVVLEGNDPLKEDRERFLHNTLLPENGSLPSQKIIQQIENMIYER